MPGQFRTMSDMGTLMTQMGMSPTEQNKVKKAMKKSGMTGVQTISNHGSLGTKDELRRMKHK